MKTVAFLVYPDMAVLDFTGPDTALSQHFKMKYVWKDKNLVQTENKHSFIQPTHTFDEIKDADILCIPGTTNPFNIAKDKALVNWIQSISHNVTYITSICTGAIILAACGLLKGKHATTHWAFLDDLKHYQAIPKEARVCRDNNIITSGGVTAGIDLAFELLNEFVDEAEVRKSELLMQYVKTPNLEVDRIYSEAYKKDMQKVKNLLEAYNATT